jgi:hypothetical protein
LEEDRNLKPKGRKIALAVMTVGLTTILASGIVLKDRFRLWWYEWRLQAEDEGRVSEAILALADLGFWKGRTPVEGTVEAVKQEDRLAVVSLGRDQDVEEGQWIVLFCGERPLGILKTTKVYENLSGARIVRTLPGTAVSIGDKACFLKKGPGGKGIAYDVQAPELVIAVRAVNSEDGVVMLDAGADQVEVGQELMITRGWKQIGKVKVFRVWEDLSSSKVTELCAGAPIQPGDRASKSR